MARVRTGRVFGIVFEPPAQGSLLRSPGEVIQLALARGRRTERYGRTWIVGPTEVHNRVLSGRIGFRGDGGIAELWDEEREDFVEYAMPAGLTAPFAVHLDTLRGAIQVRPPVIRVNSLLGAFEKLLLDADDRRWNVRGAERQMTLSDWKAQVGKITQVRFHVKVPNPHWADAPDLQTVMEDAEAEVVTLELQNDSGLNLDAPFVAQTENHVERGYGDARYVGVVEDVSGVHESVYSTKLGAEEISDEEAVDPDTGEVAPESLRHRIEGQAVLEETGGRAPTEGPELTM